MTKIEEGNKIAMKCPACGWESVYAGYIKLPSQPKRIKRSGTQDYFNFKDDQQGADEIIDIKTDVKVLPNDIITN